MATAALSQSVLQHETIRPAIASRILNSKEELLKGDLGPAIRELLEERGVLVFKKINFTDAEQIAFTKTLGEFAPEGVDGENVSKITVNPELNSEGAEYLKGSLYWHIDGTMNDVPILASLLSCHTPAAKGTGNTGFATPTPHGMHCQMIAKTHYAICAPSMLYGQPSFTTNLNRR